MGVVTAVSTLKARLDPGSNHHFNERDTDAQRLRTRKSRSYTAETSAFPPRSNSAITKQSRRHQSHYLVSAANLRNRVRKKTKGKAPYPDPDHKNMSAGSRSVLAPSPASLAEARWGRCAFCVIPKEVSRRFFLYTHQASSSPAKGGAIYHIAYGPPHALRAKSPRLKKFRDIEQI